MNGEDVDHQVLRDHPSRPLGFGELRDQLLFNRLDSGFNILDSGFDPLALVCPIPHRFGDRFLEHSQGLIAGNAGFLPE